MVVIDRKWFAIQCTNTSSSKTPSHEKMWQRFSTTGFARSGKGNRENAEKERFFQLRLHFSAPRLQKTYNLPRMKCRATCMQCKPCTDAKIQISWWLWWVVSFDKIMMWFWVVWRVTKFFFFLLRNFRYISVDFFFKLFWTTGYGFS